MFLRAGPKKYEYRSCPRANCSLNYFWISWDFLLRVGFSLFASFRFRRTKQLFSIEIDEDLGGLGGHPRSFPGDPSFSPHHTLFDAPGLCDRNLSRGRIAV